MEASASDEVGGEPQIAEDGCARSRRRERLLVQDVCADAAVHRVLDFRIRLCRRIRGCKLHPKGHLQRQRCVAHTPMARPRTLCCALNPPSASPTGNTIGCLAAAAGAGRGATAGPVCSCGSASRSKYTKQRPAGWRWPLGWADAEGHECWDGACSTKEMLGSAEVPPDFSTSITSPAPITVGVPLTRLCRQIPLKPSRNRSVRVCTRARACVLMSSSREDKKVCIGAQVDKKFASVHKPWGPCKERGKLEQGECRSPLAVYEGAIRAEVFELALAVLAEDATVRAADASVLDLACTCRVPSDGHLHTNG